MRPTTAKGMLDTITEYFDGCNEADFDKMTGCMESDAVHYFPAGAPQGTFSGADAIANGWIKAVNTLGSIWTIDRAVMDPEKREGVIEWTHFKPNVGVYLRGDEWYIFSERGLIQEIKAYYACPTATTQQIHEIGDFDYSGRGYPMTPPSVNRS